MPPVRSRALLAFLLAAAFAAPARARPLPSSVTTLTRDDFSRLNYNSLSDVLDHAVGIDVEREGYRGTAARARLRGLPQTQSLVIAIDGRPLTHSFDGAVDLAAIPLNMVERIEVTRGGAPLAYGPSAAGVVNVVTSRPSREGLLVDLETGVGRHGVRQNNGRFFDRFWLGDATYAGGVQDSGGFTFNDESELTSHFANLTRSFKKGGYLGIEYSDVNGFSDTPDGSTLPFDQWNGREERVAISPEGRHNHEIQTARVLGASPLVAGGTFYADVTKSWRGSEFLTAPKGGLLIEDEQNNTTEARLRYERDWLGLGVETNDFARRLQGAVRRDATQSGAFAQGRFRTGELEILPGVRYDNHSRAGDGVSARLAAVFRPVDSTAFNASLQRGVRFPTFDELFPVSGSPWDVDPEHVDTADAGIVYEGTGYRAAVTGFDTRVKDAIGLDSATGNFGNVGEDRSRGVEIEAGATLGEGNWKKVWLKANYTNRDARRKDAGAADFHEAPLSPRQLAYAQIEYQLPRKIRMTNEVRYESEQFEATGRAGRRLPPFAVWNLRFTAHIHTAILYVAAENLAGRRYAEHFGSPAAPGAGLAPQPARTFWTGISIRFID